MNDALGPLPVMMARMLHAGHSIRLVEQLVADENVFVPFAVREIHAGPQRGPEQFVRKEQSKFAAQKALNNTISGISLSFSRPFNIGDKIKVLSGSSIILINKVNFIARFNFFNFFSLFKSSF